MITCLLRTPDGVLNPLAVRFRSSVRSVSEISIVLSGDSLDLISAFEMTGQLFEITLTDGGQIKTWRGYFDRAESLPGGGCRMIGRGLPGLMDESARCDFHLDMDAKSIIDKLLSPYRTVQSRISLRAGARLRLESSWGETCFQQVCRLAPGIVADDGAELYIGDSYPDPMKLTRGELRHGPPTLELSARPIGFSALSRTLDPLKTVEASISSLPSFDNVLADATRTASERLTALIPHPSRVPGTFASEEEATQHLQLRARVTLADACRVRFRTSHLGLSLGTPVQIEKIHHFSDLMVAFVDCNWSKEAGYMCQATCVPLPLAPYVRRPVNRPAGPWLTTATVDAARPDPANLQRIPLRLAAHGEALIWGQVVTALAGSTFQLDWQPEPGSEVAVLFGDREVPLVIGSLHSAAVRSKTNSQDQELILRAGEAEVRIGKRGIKLKHGGSSVTLNQNFKIQTEGNLELESTEFVAKAKQTAKVSGSGRILEVGES